MVAGFGVHPYYVAPAAAAAVASNPLSFRYRCPDEARALAAYSALQVCQKSPTRLNQTKLNYISALQVRQKSPTRLNQTKLNYTKLSALQVRQKSPTRLNSTQLN